MNDRRVKCSVLIPAAVIGWFVICTALVIAGTGNTGRFIMRGVPAPISISRGTVATIDRTGSHVVLAWLYDHRGCYALLVIDTDSGEAKEYSIPFPPNHDYPYASILSTRNKLYTQFNSRFVEFDVNERSFTFQKSTVSRQTAMSMTEDDQGVIWSVSYPQCGVVSYDPQTGEFRDYGELHRQNWDQYPRYLAVDKTGWVYFAIGMTASQIVAFDPTSRKVTPVLPESERRRGMAFVYRDIDGSVYGKALDNVPGGWYRLYQGAASRIEKHEARFPKPTVAGNQWLFHSSFPDGKRLAALDLENGRVVVDDPKRRSYKKELTFRYTTEGAYIMNLASSPGGTIWGSTTYPKRYFSYDPGSGSFHSHEVDNQWNALAVQGGMLFAASYPAGGLIKLDPAQAWEPAERKTRKGNPGVLSESAPVIGRPHKLLAYPDGKTLILAGTPDYGFTGGGLLFRDMDTGATQLLQDHQVVPGHSTMSLVSVSSGRLLGGTTTAAGTGGQKRAAEAELYLMDVSTKRLIWRTTAIPGVQQYTDLCPGPGGTVYGIADKRLFFVFDLSARKVVARQDLGRFGPTVSQQGPRVFVVSPDKKVYVLFYKGIARIEPRTHAVTWLSDSPVPITAGGDYLDGQIYFASGSVVYSYRVD